MASWVAQRIINRDRLALGVRIYGATHPARPVVCLAGLTRNARDFHRFAERLSTDGAAARKVIAIDTRGRGTSERDPDPARYTVPVEAGDVLDVLDALEIRQADMIGTSRGGLILHMLAVTRPGLMTSAILNDIGPVLAPEGLRKIQAYLGHESRPANTDEAIATLQQLHGADFPALSADDWADMADAIYRQTDDGYVPDVDPAIPAAMRSLDLTTPLPDLWAAFAGMANHPLMVVRGEHSRLLSPQTVAAILERHPDATAFTAQGEGHAPLLHREATYAAIQTFLRLSADP